MAEAQIPILVLNAGSSSLKLRLIDAADERVLADGEVERVGGPGARLALRWRQGEDDWSEREEAVSASDHREALAAALGALAEAGVLPDPRGLAGIGHRVVHGGESFREPAPIDDAVIEAIRRTAALAPLHNPANLAGIEVAREAAPGVPQVAVFDTAFHATVPPRAHRYALPEQLYRDHAVRRYGFHGTSHQHVAGEAARRLGRDPADLALITLHLGNGASAAAIGGGRCLDTSMGMTPLEGLVMGTRCGDIDPAVVVLLAGRLGMDAEAMERLLNERSGLAGLCGDNDMRAVLARARDGDERATLALEVFCYRARKYVGAYLAVLGRLDALVFTAGIGERSPEVRARICEGLEGLGIVVDPRRNAACDGDGEIGAEGAPVRLLVIPTDEELAIARATAAVIGTRDAD